MKLYLINLIIIVFLSYFAFKFYILKLKKIKLLDNKNSNYNFQATPTGSGVLFLIFFLFSNLFFFIFDKNFLDILPNRYYLFLVSISVLAITSFIDDLKPIDPILRLIIQLIFVYLAITSLNLAEINYPDKLVFLCTVFIWVYIMNITNFIDGSDGFLISNFFFYCINLLILEFFFNYNIFSTEIAKICLPFAIVFFLFNKPKAKLFMGDSGSIFLGFLVGYFFLELIIIGKWYIAISLLSYNLIDCTYCLLKKMKKGIMPWIGIYDYYFLKPILEDKKNHYNVFYLINIFWFLNTSIIFLQEYFNNKYLFSLSLLLSIFFIFIFNYLNTKFKVLKFIK